MDFVWILNSQIPGQSDIINQLFPNLWVFLSHVLATIFLLALVFWLAWKPTAKYIQRRTEEIQKDMVAAEKSRIEAEKNLEASKKQILESKETALQILENAEFEADEKRKKIEMAALNKASHIEREGLSQVRKQELELEKKMNLEVSKLALETVEIFLSKKIDEEENKKLVDKIVNDLTSRVDGKAKNS